MINNLEAIRILHLLGLTGLQVQQVLRYLPVVYSLNTLSEPGIGLLHWVDQDHLRSSIIEVDTPGDGLQTFGRFRSLSKDLARSLGLDELTLFGAAVINNRLERLLINQGFAASVELIPDELGNDGSMNVYPKVFPLKKEERRDGQL